MVSHNLLNFDGNAVELKFLYSSKTTSLDCGTLIPITARKSNDSIYFELLKKLEGSDDSAAPTITRIGDCLAPGLTADAGMTRDDLSEVTADATADRAHRVR